jgi:hypothetical protein
MSANVANKVLVDWKASMLVGVNSSVGWALGCGVGVACGGVLDDGWEKPGIAVGGGVDAAQPEIRNVKQIIIRRIDTLQLSHKHQETLSI